MSVFCVDQLAQISIMPPDKESVCLFALPAFSTQAGSEAGADISVQYQYIRLASGGISPNKAVDIFI